jgi:flavin-dependent dehydrogenase
LETLICRYSVGEEIDMNRIRILGSGPSGLSAAITLAQAGCAVDVYEIRDDVGMRFHGDLQGLENWSKKEDILQELGHMNVKINFDCDPFSKLTITDGTRIKEINFENPIFYLVKRGPLSGSLDYGLKEQAEESGVTIHFKKTVPEHQADIVAVGPASDNIPAIDKGIIFKTDMKDSAILLLHEKAAYKGYAYLLVTKGYGCMCTVVFGDLGSVTQCFEETKKMFSSLVDLDVHQPKKVGGIGSFSVKNVFEKNGRLYVGEAAGLQDFLWGFGMRYAITSGFLAAKTILNGGDYSKTARKWFANRMKASITNRYLWEKVENRYKLIVNNGKAVQYLLYRVHNYGLIQRLIYPRALSYVQKRYSHLCV